MQHESFWKRLGQFRHGKLLLELELERVHRRGHRTRDEARSDIFNYIECF